MTADPIAEKHQIKPHAQSRMQYDLPPYDGAQVADYVICSTPRCGSTLLGSLLIACGFMGVPTEYFNARHMSYLKERLGASDLAGYITALRRIRTSPNGIFGIKTHFNQLKPLLPAVLEQLHTPVYVHITRADTIAQAISLTIAQQTDAWSSEAVSSHEPRYDEAAIARNKAAIEAENDAWEQFFEQQGITPITMDYDDLVADPHGQIQPICAALGVDNDHTFDLAQSPKKKQANDVNKEWHARFDGTG